MFWRAYFTLHHDRDGLEASESYGNYLYLGGRTRNLLGTVADAYFFAALGLGVLGLWRIRAGQDAAAPVRGARDGRARRPRHW